MFGMSSDRKSFSLEEWQAQFAEALCSPRAGVGGLRPEASGGAGVGRRFAVYRNNVYHSLIRALADTYPVVERLVGEEFFRACGRAFLDGGGFPKLAPLHDFGGGFGAFLDGFAPASARLPWLGDVARVERAWLDAWNGADGSAVSVVLLRWPAVEIWRAHQLDGEDAVAAALGRVSLREEVNTALAVRDASGVVEMRSYVGDCVERLLADSSSSGCQPSGERYSSGRKRVL